MPHSDGDAEAQGRGDLQKARLWSPGVPLLILGLRSVPGVEGSGWRRKKELRLGLCQGLRVGGSLSCPSQPPPSRIPKAEVSPGCSSPALNHTSDFLKRWGPRSAATGALCRIYEPWPTRSACGGPDLRMCGPAASSRCWCGLGEVHPSALPAWPSAPSGRSLRCGPGGVPGNLRLAQTLD